MQTNVFLSLDDASSSYGGGGNVLAPHRGPSIAPASAASRSSSRGSFNREPGHLTPSHFARSSSLGGHTRANPTSSSLGQESGFQSCTSLVSLGHQQQQLQQPQLQAKHSLFRGSPLAQRLQSDMESSLSGSMASLASGVIVPSLVNGI